MLIKEITAWVSNSKSKFVFSPLVENAIIIVYSFSNRNSKIIHFLTCKLCLSLINSSDLRNATDDILNYILLPPRQF